MRGSAQTTPRLVRRRPTALATDGSLTRRRLETLKSAFEKHGSISTYGGAFDQTIAFLLRHRSLLADHIEGDNAVAARSGLAMLADELIKRFSYQHQLADMAVAVGLERRYYERIWAARAGEKEHFLKPDGKESYCGLQLSKMNAIIRGDWRKSKTCKSCLKYESEVPETTEREMSLTPKRQAELKECLRQSIRATLPAAGALTAEQSQEFQKDLIRLTRSVSAAVIIEEISERLVESGPEVLYSAHGHAHQRWIVELGGYIEKHYGSWQAAPTPSVEQYIHALTKAETIAGANFSRATDFSIFHRELLRAVWPDCLEQLRWLASSGHDFADPFDAILAP